MAIVFLSSIHPNYFLKKSIFFQVFSYGSFFLFFLPYCIFLAIIVERRHYLFFKRPFKRFSLICFQVLMVKNKGGILNKQTTTRDNDNIQ